MDGSVFQTGVDLLRQSTWEIQSLTDTSVTGTVEVTDRTVLYTSIPSNGNWTATVDGVQTEPILLCDTMVALRLTPGQHTITFTYQNTALQQGIAVSLTALAIFLCLTALSYSPWKKGKFQDRSQTGED